MSPVTLNVHPSIEEEMKISLRRRMIGACKKFVMVVDKGDCPEALCSATRAPHPPMEARAKPVRMKYPCKAKDVAIPDNQC